MNKYAVMIQVDDELIYVSEDNPFNYNSIPKVFDTQHDAEVEAKAWKTGRVVPYHVPSWDNWTDGDIK